MAEKQSYEDWMKRVDAFISGLCGMCHNDLPDKNWRDEYDGGSTPADACENVGYGNVEDMMMNM